MSIPPANRTDEQLRNIIQNHRDKGVTDAPLYLDALRELDERKGKGLSFDKSFAIIKSAAAERRFISYKDLADESGARWTQVHYSVGSHLWSLVEYAHRKGWPMLSAIVVNKENLDTGTMQPETLKGFVAAARELGHLVTDEQAFLREQQEKVFEWAQIS